MTETEPKSARDLMRTRARRLAARTEARAQETVRDPVLVVRLGPERFALRMTAVAQVLPCDRVRTVPTAPARVLGVMAIRGEIHSIYALEALLDRPTTVHPAAGQVVVLRGMNQVGVRVDAVEAIDFVTTPESPGEKRPYVKPISSEPLILLENVSSLISNAAGDAP